MADSVAGFFSALKDKVDPNKVAGINAVYQFKISGDNGGDWTIALKDGHVDVSQGEVESPDITISTSDTDWLDIVNGTLNPTTAFLTGRVKVQGDPSLALKLQSLM